MSLREDLENAATKPNPCSACLAIERVDKDDKVALEMAMMGTIGAKRLAAILRANGFTVGENTIARHRREDH